MLAKNRSKSNRIIRRLRARKKLNGTPERPRLSICPSIKHMEAQIINDFESRTLVGFTTKAESFQKETGSKTGSNVQSATKFGKFVAEKAKAKGISKVVFDRGGFQYHGRIKAFAEAARENGLVF